MNAIVDNIYASKYAAIWRVEDARTRTRTDGNFCKYVWSGTERMCGVALNGRACCSG